MPPADETPSTAFPGFERVASDAGEVVDRLAAIRRARGLSQTAIAARMGTSQSAVARLESGCGEARLSTLGRYAAALDVQIGFALRAAAGDDAEGVRA